MADMSIIGGIAASLRLMGDITKLAIETRDFTLMREKVIELQTIILSAQSGALSAQADQFAMLERVRELEQQFAKMEAWDTEKQRYGLKSVYHGGSIVYSLKPDAQGTEPPHWICASCYERHKKSILQRTKPHLGLWLYRCNTCKEEIQATFDGPADAAH